MKRSPLAALHEARGAQWMAYQGWEIPRCFASVEAEYQAVQEGAGLLDLSHRALLRVTGRDRRTWLQGLLSQDVEGLAEGRGAYSVLMNAQGHMVSDLRLFALPDALLLDFPAAPASPMPEYLEGYLVMERARVESLEGTIAALSLQGPLAPHALAAVFGEEPSRLQRWQIAESRFAGEPLWIARVPACGEDGFDLFVPAARAPSLWATLSRHRAELAVHSVGWEALNLRRLEAGIPWWGEELDSSLVPLEARLDHAVSRTKGCYLGQEIIARIDARGHVNNLLAGFLVRGERLPERGAEIRHGGKKVGRVASAVRSPRLDRLIALGYLRRELQETGTVVEATAAPAPLELEVTPLPFIPDDYPAEAA